MLIFSQHLIHIYKVPVNGQRIKDHNFTLFFNERMEGRGKNGGGGGLGDVCSCIKNNSLVSSNVYSSS